MQMDKMSVWMFSPRVTIWASRHHSGLPAPYLVCECEGLDMHLTCTTRSRTSSSTSHRAEGSRPASPMNASKAAAGAPPLPALDTGGC